MQQIKWLYQSLLVFILLLITITHALANEKRVALLIANQAYTTSPLKNPISDAELIASRLKKLDYQVVLLTNANRYQMIDHIEAFGREAQDSDSAVFYYSGHGMQDDYRQNYLLPVDATISSEANIRGYGVEAYEVINALKKAKPRISLVIFDACRDNPFAGVRGNRNFSVEAYRTDNEMLVSYATQTGQYAQDGRGSNSPYAIALAEQLEHAKQSPLLLMFDKVQERVKELTNNKQSPTKMGDAKTTTFLVHHSGQAYLFPSPPLQDLPITLPPPSSDERFNELMAKGVYWDRNTNLMWMRCTLSQTWNGKSCEGASEIYYWDEAVKEVPYLNQDKYGGFDDWQLPSISQFITIRYCKNGYSRKYKKLPNTDDEIPAACRKVEYNVPTLDPSIFPFKYPKEYWSKDIGRYYDMPIAWAFSSKYGTFISKFNRERSRVIAVREANSF